MLSRKGNSHLALSTQAILSGAVRAVSPWVRERCHKTEYTKLSKPRALKARLMVVVNIKFLVLRALQSHTQEFDTPLVLHGLM